MSITEKNGLKINTKLLDFVNNEIIQALILNLKNFGLVLKKLCMSLRLKIGS